jgi:hydroxypyruvate reductase
MLQTRDRIVPRMQEENLRRLLTRAFDAAVEIAQPRHCLADALPRAPRGRTLVVGAGKASASMAAAFEGLWPGDLSGLVLTRHGHAVPTDRIEIVEAGHPVPDEAGHAATARVLDLLGGVGPDDLVVGLFSGGGSSLLCAPAGGLTLAEKQEINRALLASGAPIEAMNVVRKHLSLVKGGRLALAAPETPFVSLIMSDVPGDDLSTIASGPTVADASTLAQAREIVERWSIPLPEAARRLWADDSFETPKSGDPRLAHVTNKLVMTPAQALQGAAKVLRREGVEVLFLGDDVEGEAREVAKQQADLALRLADTGKPLCILSGGECTVTVRARGGRGGRNAEYLLALALELEGHDNMLAIAADTDGIDGSESNAGALMTHKTLHRARLAGIDPAGALAVNDAYSVFEASGDLLVTGPTHTNVNDFRAILIMPRG